MKFNERVLEEAENQDNPLCERLTFASIYQSNLDEFYMVRVGSLVDQMFLSKDIRENKTNMTPKEQLEAVLSRTRKLNRKRDVIYEEIMDSLKEYGVQMLNFHKIEKEDRNYLERYFEAEVAPVISPSIVGKRQPFPFLRNREIYAVVVLETKKGKEKLGIIPCSSTGIQRLIPVPGKEGTYMLSEELILHFVSKIFKGYHIKAKSLLRITRNADIDADAFILDCIPNPSPKEITDRTVDFVMTLRQKHPDTPIIVIQTLIRETGNFNQKARENVKRQNEVIAEQVEVLRKKNVKNLYFIKEDQFLGTDHEGTVDGTHPNDLGFDRMLKKYKLAISKILKIKFKAE